MRRGLIKAVREMLEFACAYAGEGHPDARDEQLPIFVEIKKAALDALVDNNQLIAIAKAAVEMHEKCPADDDSTNVYWDAVGVFKALVGKYNAKYPGVLR